jgi:hypothetical protein
VKFICGKSATSNGNEWSPIAPGKAIRVVLATFSAPVRRLGIAPLENLWGRLTQENNISRLGLLHLALACGNLFENASLPQG